MIVSKKIQNRFFKTRLFKGLLGDYEKTTKTKIVPQKQLQTFAKINDEKIELEKTLPTLIEGKVQEEIQKLETFHKNEAMRYRMPYRFNDNKNPDRKPFADVPFSYLRRMAVLYPIARACINRRIRQITQLQWDITTIDDIDGEGGYDSQIKLLKAFFKSPLGPNTRIREMLTMMVDDILTVDAISYEYQKTRGQEFMYLIPVDPTTIALRVDETGATPQPPDIAYAQIIGGKVIAEFSTDEMLYDAMNNRSYSPYGQGPLESLILQVESALRGTLYNLGYFRDNNVPEGFITLPNDVVSNQSQVEEWQTWFDALLAGDNRTIHRLKILPGGATYTAAKKPEDMSFEKFEMWMLQQTCAVFEVQPQDIGITYQVNRATGESQKDISVEKGLIPLGNFIKEIFDNVIQKDFGMENLQFKWVNINPVDKKEESEIAKVEIDMGAMSVDEYRIKQGLEPIGVEHYIMTSSGPMFTKDLIAGTVGPKQTAVQAEANTKALAEAKANGPMGNNNPNDKKDNTDEQKQKLMNDDLRRWKKCLYSDLEKGRKLRTKFPSEFIDAATHNEIENVLKTVSSRLQVKLLFDQYLDPELKSSMTLLKFASELRKIEHDVSA